MNARAIGAVIRKDLKVVSQNKGVALPILLVPLLLFGIFPWIVALMPVLQGLMGGMPADISQAQSLLSQTGSFAEYFLLQLMAPLFLLVPLMVSTVIAADSFAGEKERKTMEALLYTPTTDRELFVAKLLSAWLTAVAVTFFGFLLYAVTANAAAWSQMHRIFFPNTMWLVLVFWVAPALPGLGLGVMVLVSSRAQGFQDASQMSSIVVLPVVLLIVMTVTGAMSFSVTLALMLGLGIWLLAGLLIWLGSRIFSRGRLLGA